MSYLFSALCPFQNNLVKIFLHYSSIHPCKISSKYFGSFSNCPAIFCALRRIDWCVCIDLWTFTGITVLVHYLFVLNLYILAIFFMSLSCQRAYLNGIEQIFSQLVSQRKKVSSLLFTSNLYNNSCTHSFFNFVYFHRILDEKLESPLLSSQRAKKKKTQTATGMISKCF